MAYVYKGIKPTDIKKTSIKTNRAFNLNTSSLGLSSIQFISNSYSNEDLKVLNDAGKHWIVLATNFYLSGSFSEERKFENPFFTYQLRNPNNPQHLNKFYSSGSVIYIPQQYFGEEIKRKSFKFTDLNSTDNTGNNPIIRDDGFGNLYSTNAYHSQSGASSISSSDNYVGNIFYNIGVVALTETGSWSGSVNYTDLATNYKLEFDSSHVIYSTEYTLRVNPSEFNFSNNPTCKAFKSGSTTEIDNGRLKSELTSSGWTAHMNTIGLYRTGDVLPSMVAKVSQPIKIRDDMTLIFKIRQDLF